MMRIHEQYHPAFSRLVIESLRLSSCANGGAHVLRINEHYNTTLFTLVLSFDVLRYPLFRERKKIC